MSVLAPPEPEVISDMIAGAISGTIDTTPRSQQKKEGTLGPSDLGFCRNKAALVTKGVEPTDARNMLWAAGVGTAVHDYLTGVLRPIFPDWIIEKERVSATFSNGAVVSGTPDIVIPEWNTLLDNKTVDGFGWVKREGTSQNHKFQRATYALGAVQGGLLNNDEPLYVGNVYFDRSGKEQKPYVLIEELNWSIIDEVSAWIDDVIYAVTNDEDAQRDIPAGICERICEFYTVCRGGLPVEEGMLITHPELLSAVEMYVDGRQQRKVGAQMMDEAKAILTGLSGSTGEYQVRTTHVPAGEVAGFRRNAYDKLEVVKIRRGKK